MNEQKIKKGKMRGVGIAVIVVLLLGVVGYIAWSQIDKESDKKSDTKDTSQVAEEAAPSGKDEQVGAKLVERKLRTSDGYEVTYKIPENWTGWEEAANKTPSEYEDIVLEAPDGFGVRVSIGQLIRGGVMQEPKFKIIDEQKVAKSHEVQWIVVDGVHDDVYDEPISLQIKSTPDQTIGTMKASEGGLLYLGASSGDTSNTFQVYGKYAQSMSRSVFESMQSVKDAKAMIESMIITRP